MSLIITIKNSVASFSPGIQLRTVHRVSFPCPGLFIFLSFILEFWPLSDLTATF